MNRKRAILATIPLVLVVVLCMTAWLYVDSLPWTYVTAPSPYPHVDPRAQPDIVTVSQLMQRDGILSPKPVVAADPMGNVVVVAHGISPDPPMGSDIVAWNSHDHGVVWSSWTNLTNRSESDTIYFDPWIETDRRGHFYIIYSQTIADGCPAIRRSKDGGRTWSNEITLPWTFCDRPVLGISPNGRDLIVAGNMSEKTDEFPTTPVPGGTGFKEEWVHNYGGLFLSNDFGETWEKLNGPYDDLNVVPFAVVVDDDARRIAASWIVAGHGSHNLDTWSRTSRSTATVSEERGVSWTETVLVESLQPDREHPFNGERFPVIAMDGQRHFHVAYVDDMASQLKHRKSVDGKTWNEARNLSQDDAEEVRMPAVDTCGSMVHITWLERTGEMWHSYYCGSGDYGENWTSPLCLSKSMTMSDKKYVEGFKLESDDDQSSVRDDGTGRVHAVWSIRGGRVIHAAIDWKR